MFNYPGAGLFWSIGIGLGVGLFCRINWGFYALFGAILVATISVIARSEHYLNYIKNCETKKTKPNKLLYLVLSFVTNSVIIWGIAILIFAIRFIR